MPGITLTWQHDTPAGLTYNVYENDALIVENVGVLNFSIDMANRPSGNYIYQVSAVRTSDNVEGARSEPVTANFTQDPPLPPIGLSITLQQG